ncbi:MAG TPA: DMT family transporter [Frankiaceae bacterium]
MTPAATAAAQAAVHAAAAARHHPIADQGMLGGALALAAAVCFGVCSALQHRSSRQVAYAAPLAPGLLLSLGRNRLWLLGSIADVGGLVLQVLALGQGSLVLVEPLLAAGLLVAVPLGALLDHRPVDRLEWLGALVCTAGLGGFLAGARPTVGLLLMPRRGSIVLAVASAALIGACLLLARRHGTEPTTRRGVLVGLAAGTALGASAALLKTVDELFVQHGFGVLAHPALYLLLALGGAGLLLTQNAFQAGPLGPTLAVLTVAEPVIGVLVGLTALKERVSTTPGALALQALGAAAAIGGLVLLAIATGRADRAWQATHPAPAEPVAG